MAEATGTTLGRIAASAGPAPARGRELLLALRAAVPFDAAWLAFADPQGDAYLSVARLGLEDATVAFLTGPAMAQHIAATGADRDRPPVSRADHPRPATQRCIWVDCLSPAGFRESLSVGLFAGGGRRVGFLILLFRSSSPPSRTARRRLAELAPVLALGIDPMPVLLATTRLVPEVTAGAVLRDDDAIEALVGLGGDPLLTVGSPVLTVARMRLDDGMCHSSFLWPLGGSSAPDGHAQITVVVAPDDVPDFLLGVVMVSLVQDLRGLTPRELEVLGLVIHGYSNQEIARTLVVAPRTVAAHVEHVLAKLGASTRTTAAVRAEREGLYVPALVGCLPGEPGFRGREN